MGLLGDHARVRVPATSANLGPGYDSMGLALSITDEVEVRVCAGPTRVEVVGEGAGVLATDDSHLVVRALHRGLAAAGCERVNVDMRCHNRIAQSRGMGSSASAIVAGLALARQLTGTALSEDDLLNLATQMEGHPDNVAPALYGGITVAWMGGDRAHCLRLDPPADLALSVAIPTEGLETSRARALLPAEVPHADAAFNAGRAALLAASLATGRGDLFAATEDRLHQPYRASAMPASARLVHLLRARQIPAVISGAGPCVLSFGRLDAQARAHASELGFEVRDVECAREGVEVLSP